MPPSAIKPQVVYFCDEPELVERVKLSLSHTFEVVGVTDPTDLDGALSDLRRIRPNYVLVDPHLPALDHRQLHRRLKSDPALKDIQILVISEDQP
jgi:CheY-like chemotaxis protein